jgi:hypothetical protein
MPAGLISHKQRLMHFVQNTLNTENLEDIIESAGEDASQGDQQYGFPTESKSLLQNEERAVEDGNVNRSQSAIKQFFLTLKQQSSDSLDPRSPVDDSAQCKYGPGEKKSTVKNGQVFDQHSKFGL